MTFPDPATGACPTGTVPIPRLRITLSYRVPPGPSYALDSFPDQQRKPVTDHFDFENVMPEPLMRRSSTASTPAAPAEPGALDIPSAESATGRTNCSPANDDPGRP